MAKRLVAIRITPHRLLGLLAVLWVLASCAAVPAQTSPPMLVMISIDGLRPDYVTAAAAHGARVPALRRFLVDGAFADGVEGSFPP